MSLSNGMSVCHTSQPYKNGRSDWDAVWVEDSGGPKEPWGPDHPWEGGILRGKRSNHGRSKTAEPIEVLFRLRARMSPGNRVLESRSTSSIVFASIANAQSWEDVLPPHGEYDWTIRLRGDAPHVKLLWLLVVKVIWHKAHRNLPESDSSRFRSE